MAVWRNDVSAEDDDAGINRFSDSAANANTCRHELSGAETATCVAGPAAKGPGMPPILLCSALQHPGAHQVVLYWCPCQHDPFGAVEGQQGVDGLVPALGFEPVALVTHLADRQAGRQAEGWMADDCGHKYHPVENGLVV